MKVDLLRLRLDLSPLSVSCVCRQTKPVYELGSGLLPDKFLLAPCYLDSNLYNGIK